MFLWERSFGLDFFCGKAFPGLIYSGVAELALRFIISSKWEISHNVSRI